MSADTRHDCPEQLSALDMVFLSLEDAAPMHLGAVILLNTAHPHVATTAISPAIAPDSALPRWIGSELGSRAQQVTRLRQRITPCYRPVGGAVWTEDPDPCVHSQIHTHHLSAGGWEALSALTADLMGQPLARDRPPWELHVIGGLDDGRVAVLAKLHHALCDGAGAIQLGLSLLDGADQATAQTVGADSAIAGRTATSPPPSSWWPPRPDQLAKAATVAAGVIVSRAAAARETGTRLGIGTGIVSAAAQHLRLPAPRSPLAAPLTDLRFAMPSAVPFAGGVMVAEARARRVAMLRIDEQELRTVRRVHAAPSTMSCSGYWPVGFATGRPPGANQLIRYGCGR